MTDGATISMELVNYFLSSYTQKKGSLLYTLVFCVDFVDEHLLGICFSFFFSESNNMRKKFKNRNKH